MILTRNFLWLVLCTSFLLCKTRSEEFNNADEKQQELLESIDTIIPEITKPLLESDRLSYTNLSLSSHGRHLLLISLLEKVQSPFWVPRCSGLLQLFLPPNLAPPDQPPLGNTGQMLKDVTNQDGSLLERNQLIMMLNDIENVFIWPGTHFSRFDKYHMAVVHRLASLFNNQSSFDSMYSIMVAFKEFLSDEMFVDAVYQVIQKRKDVGFVIPSVVTVQPEDFFPGALLDILAEENSSRYGNSSRKRRQADTWARGGMIEVAWHQGMYRTMPDWEPEGRLWYFNEDPLINANHFHWHQVLSSEVEYGSRLHSSHLDRRGEMFYFMHRQLLCRMNNERLSVGLNLTKSFGPDRWGQPVYPGYDPKLGRGSVERFAPRPAGATMYPFWQREMEADLASVKAAIDQGVLIVGGRQIRLQYRNGIDMGISALGDVVESYIPNRYGDLHNFGHTVIAKLHKGSGEGVMNSPNVAMRDPLFGQWHKFVDDVFQEYKNKLGHYQDSDLDFPGVSVTSLTLQSVTPQAPNSLTTFLDHRATVQLNSLDLTRAGSSSVMIRYSRLDHVAFTYSITVASSLPLTRGMIRIFLIPADVAISPEVDITQLAIEMDRFQVSLTQGLNTISRSSSESSFVAKSRDSLYELQRRLMQGTITEDQFNWAGCGWPKEMTLPRGSEYGKPFRVFLVLSPLLQSDAAHTSPDWRGLEQQSWSWCGVRKDKGGMPDSRPMGFPLDRPPPGGTWRGLIYRGDGSRRINMAVTNVNITYLANPWGLATDTERL